MKRTGDLLEETIERLTRERDEALARAERAETALANYKRWLGHDKR